MELTGLQVLALMAVIGVAVLIGLCMGVLFEGHAKEGRRAAEKSPPPKRRKTSNTVLVILALFALAFIVAMTVIFCVKDSMPDTLIQYTLGAGGMEALLLAGIKVKSISGRHNNDYFSDGAENEQHPEPYV